MSIPKVIHYCWFGGNPKPKLAEKCIKSWKKYCPDYEIIEWNESNFDIKACPRYVQQAYEAKKWAFVSDYVRLKIIYENGGIYLDTDVELIKPLDSLLKNDAFFGIENDGHFPFYIATGLGFGAKKGVAIIDSLLKDYSDIDYKISETEYDLMPCPKRNNPTFVAYGFNSKNTNQSLRDNISVFQSEYFCPICYETGEIKKTSNTFSIHHFAASWLDNEAMKRYQLQKKQMKFIERKHYIKTIPNRIIMRILGKKRYELLKSKIKR